MPISLPSHLYRNRHGTFYFRHCIPKALRGTAGTGELRFSLGTQDRQTAIISALPLIADLPRLADCLQRMADSNETPPQDFFKLWQRQVLDNAKLRTDIHILKDELEGYRDQLAGMVPKDKARAVVKQSHTLGQLRGKQELEQRLVFPWPPGKTRPFSQLLATCMRSFSFRAKGGWGNDPRLCSVRSHSRSASS